MPTTSRHLTGSRLTVRTLGLALVGLAVACGHAAVAGSTSSSIGTTRGGAGGSRGNVVSFTRDSGSRSGINLVRGEKQRFAKASPTRSTQRARPGLRRNIIGTRADRDPPVIIVRRASAAPARPRVEGLLPFDRLDPAAGASFATLAMLDSDALALAPRELLGAGVVASDASPMYDLWFDLPEDIDAQQPDYPVVPSLETAPQAIDETFLAVAGPTPASVPSPPAAQSAAMVVVPPVAGQIEGGSLRRMRGQ